LNELGAFGRKLRRVLWLYPDSSSTDENDDAIPLLPLHQKLEQAFPGMCKDQTKGSNCSPHTTLPHFENLDDAMAAEKRIETDFPTAILDFLLDRRVYTCCDTEETMFNSCGSPKSDFGTADSTVERLDPSRPLPDMQTKEDDLVHEERMQLKARRTGRGCCRRNSGRLTVSATIQIEGASSSE
jgi:hypothetical protein